MLLCTVPDIEDHRPRGVKLKLKKPLKSCEIPEEETDVQLVVKRDQSVCVAKLESYSLAAMSVQCFQVVKCCIILGGSGKV